MKYRVLLALGLIVAAALGGAGCASFVAAEQLQVSVVDLRPGASTVWETEVELAVRVTNEGDRPVALSGSAHMLWINGTAVGRGVSHEAVTVPALGTAVVRVTVHLENLALIRKAAELREAPQVSYRLESRFAREAGWSVNVRTEGALDLRPLLQGR